MNQRVKVPISDIVESDRQRVDYGDVPALADSMQRLGLIQPIVVDQSLRLIAGGRRLAAARSLGWTEIDAVFREVLDEAELAELELEENVRRKNFSWQEHCLAVARIHQLKQRNTLTSLSPWGIRETGELFNVSAGKVAYTLAIARALRADDKEIKSCLTISDALRILTQRKEDEAMKELLSRTSSIPAQTIAPAPADSLGLTDPIVAPGGEGRYQQPIPSVSFDDEQGKSKVYLSSRFVKADCLTWLKDYINVADAIITDPPYAIDVDFMQQSSGGMRDISRISETHQVDDNLSLLDQLFPLAYNTLRESGFLVLWCDIMRWQMLYDTATAAGFSVQRWPIVWHKTSPCINQMANKNYTKNVEFAILCRKGNAVLAKPATSCVISAPNIKMGSSHPFTKPAEVWQFILSHVCIQNSLVIDPFMGVGSSILPALSAGCRVMGCEIDETHHAHAVENIKHWYKEKLKEVVFL